MEKSESIKEIAAALVKFQNEVGGVKKDGTNPFYKSKYATFGNIVDTVRTSMVKHGLSFSQMPQGENELTTVLLHTSGEYLSATVKMTPKDSTPQGQGSAITYMKRYALSAILGISTDDDDDGNAASQKPYYDTSDIPDDAPIIVSGADSVTPPKKIIPPKSVSDTKAKEREIVALVNDIVLEPIDGTVEQKRDKYRTYVWDNTHLLMDAVNYTDIITRLKKIKAGEIIEE